MGVRVFQLPGCTSCRNAAAWLSEHRVPVEYRHIRSEAPSRDELAAMAALHAGGAAGLCSSRSVRFRELNLAGREFTDAEWLDLLASEPKLLRRPLITDGRRLVVGFDRRGLEALERA